MDALDRERLYREGFAEGRREFAAQVRRARAASEAELPALSREVVERARVAREIAPDLAGRSVDNEATARSAAIAANRGGLDLDQAARAAAALDTWWDDGSPWAPTQSGRVWTESELAEMHAALEASTVDDALRAVGAPPDDDLSDPEEDVRNRSRMGQLRNVLGVGAEASAAGRSEARLRELAVHRGYLSALDPYAVDLLQGDRDLVELDEYLRSPASRGLMQEDEIGEDTAQWFRTTLQVAVTQPPTPGRPNAPAEDVASPAVTAVPEVDPALADTLLRENAGDDGITQGESDAARGAISNAVISNARGNTDRIKTLTRRVRSIASSRAAAGLDALAATATTAAERLHDQARRDYRAENHDLRR